jgi:cell division initiation protein
VKLSPLDIYNKEFKKSTFGYNVSEVNDFLDEVGMAYEKLLREINSLKDENERMEEKVKNYENIETKLNNTLKKIQHTVKEEKEQAREEAKHIVNKAHTRATEIKDEARKEVGDEYRKIEELKEKKKLFEIRFKTLLQSHLEMLENKDNLDNFNINEDIAASSDNYDYDNEELELDE